MQAQGKDRAGVVFVTGGARSGKSGFVLRLAEGFAGRKAFIATAEATDEEMAERIRRHRQDRDGSWTTIEEPLDLSRALSEASAGHDLIVIDCLTLWLSNLLMAGYDIGPESDRLVSALKEMREKKVCIVSNEVGMGIVPANELARRFRDEAGRLNGRIAEIADEVYMTVSGIPLKLKGEVSDDSRDA